MRLGENKKAAENEAREMKRVERGIVGNENKNVRNEGKKGGRTIKKNQ